MYKPETIVDSVDTYQVCILRALWLVVGTVVTLKTLKQAMLIHVSIGTALLFTVQ